MSIGRSQPDEELEKFEKAALKNLETAVERSKGEIALRMREWLLNGDPDLSQLRPRHGFQAFEARHFPSPNPNPLRVPDAYWFEE